MLTVPAAHAAAHNPILPHPQSVRYTVGSLAVNGLSICFGSNPSPEDRFTAQQLASGLSAIGQTLVPIREITASGPAILLTRTGDVSAMPLADERPGRNRVSPTP